MSYWELEFDQAGRTLRGEEMLATPEFAKTRDLIVFSHGWSTSSDDARRLYQAMINMISDLLPSERKPTTGFAGVLWPSMLFPEDAPATTGKVVGTDMTHSAAEAASSPVAVRSSGGELAAALTHAFPGKEENLLRLGVLLDQQPQETDRLEEFHKLASDLVTTPAQAPEDAGEKLLLSEPTGRVMEVMAGLSAADDGEVLSGNPFDTLWRGAREVLRTLSYYEMKNRAGEIGEIGLGGLITRLSETAGHPRVHLIGHSFGARLVSFALAGLPESLRGDRSPVKSLMLIQAAFSHFSFAPRIPIDHARSGVLAAHADKIDGPILATYTAADRAVGWWYPNASRLSRQDNQDTNDFNYRWGGLGHDGFQQDDVIDRTMLEAGAPYSFESGSFHRLDANDVIKTHLSRFSGAHSDIRHSEVAWAAVAAADLSPR